MVKIGLELFEKKIHKRFRNCNAGLLVHPASINKSYKHAIEILQNSKKIKLKALFGPQHGFYGHTQDNMIEWEDFFDKKTKLPVYSLYGKTRKPTLDMLKDIDLMIIDLQDVGSRYYTFIWTMDLCMEVCYEIKKGVIILDRPNPINANTIEGTVLENKFTSFVGQKPLPIRHGMTIGEIANYLKNQYYPRIDLQIITMENYKRNMWFDKTGLPWVMPSPNMPTLDTAIVYPGMCLLEGTNISEGRGTTKPFEIFGAPFIEPALLTNKLNELNLEGVVFRPLYFQPTFNKYIGTICGGAQIHIIDRKKFEPFKTAITIIKTIYALYYNDFSWRPPPYEYEQKKLPFDILVGTDKLRKFIENGEKLEYIVEWYQEECNNFNRNFRKHSLLYK